jgi:beta-fructofuranosidase
MVLRLDDQWIWDFWLVQDGSDYHIFYLQAPRLLQQERLRHWHV